MWPFNKKVKQFEQRLVALEDFASAVYEGFERHEAELKELKTRAADNFNFLLSMINNLCKLDGLSKDEWEILYDISRTQLNRIYEMTVLKGLWQCSK